MSYFIFHIISYQKCHIISNMWVIVKVIATAIATTTIIGINLLLLYLQHAFHSFDFFQQINEKHIRTATAQRYETNKE